MPELGPYGSVRGALSNERPYRDLRNVVANYSFERSHRFPGIQRIPATETIRVFRCGIWDTQLRGRSAADASSLTHPRCCDGGRPIGDARVPQAIGQPFDRLVPAEAEVLGARVADRPATLPLAKLEQRTCPLSSKPDIEPTSPNDQV